MSVIMPSPRPLKPVAQQPGRPLYQIVKETIREAIDAGTFKPGQQMPSTKDLSDQLKVSLVTAHRALQELVAAGVLQRAQGKGTFVHDRYHDKSRAVSAYRVGLVFHAEASLEDNYHSAILEGVRQACNEHALDLIHLRFGEDLRNECNGYLLVNPLAEDVEPLARRATKRQPVLVVGARPDLKHVAWCDVDNVRVGREAVRHLANLGHRRIGYVGGTRAFGNSRDRWEGFVEGCRDAAIPIDDRHVLKAAGWKLDEHAEQQQLARMLVVQDHPTAIFAAGYFFALNVYSAAATAGLKIPTDLSVIGVDDPPGATHLSPPLTTLRQPLTDLGKVAVTALWDQMRHDGAPLENQLLQADLVQRASTAPPHPSHRASA